MAFRISMSPPPDGVFVSTPRIVGWTERTYKLMIEVSIYPGGPGTQAPSGHCVTWVGHVVYPGTEQHFHSSVHGWGTRVVGGWGRGGGVGWGVGGVGGGGGGVGGGGVYSLCEGDG